MKKNIIRLIVIAVIAVVAALVVNYFMSFHNVNFKVKQSGLTIKIFNSNNVEIKSSIDSRFAISIRNGQYYYSATGDKVKTDKTSFSIDNSISTISIDPDYSTKYLSNLLLTEDDSILQTINDRYPTIIDNYTIKNKQLFSKGEWFGAIIERKTQLGDIADPYRIILHKQNDLWSIVHYPEIIATKYNFPEVPIVILDSINDLDE